MAAISHALVLPDRDFDQWLDAVRPYLQAFERVGVVRSVAGNDLNRFRNVTAVQAPREWMNDDALTHIRRIYPLVVRVDVIPVQTPAQLRAALQARIQRQDRYGESMNVPRHLFDRFILNWPTTARPSRIERPFSAQGTRYEGVEITAPAGTLIHAAAPGTVSQVVTQGDALGYGPYLQTTVRHEGAVYVVTYGGCRATVPRGQAVSPGDAIGTAVGPSLRLVLQNPPGGASGFRLPNVVDPTLFIYWQGLRLRPTVNNLRVRASSNLQSAIVTTVQPGDAIEPNEVHGRVLAKVGREGAWIRINVPGTRDSYVAAWFLQAFSLDDDPGAIQGVPLPGINLDIHHAQGRPDPSLLRNLGWVRLLFNVSLNPTIPEGDPRRYGNTDVDAAFNRYRPYLEACARAGLRVILVLTHQTYGEGQGFVWHQMNADRWREHRQGYVAMLRQVAARFRGTGLVDVYQIWNEQDTVIGQERAAVPMPPGDYALLLGESLQAIRSADPAVRVITGGHVSGTESGAAYAETVLKALPAGLRPDGIALHPYGKGPADSPFAPFGRLDDIVSRFARVQPGQPLWITEWGVLDQQGRDDLAGQVTQYANANLNLLRRGFPGMVAAACWYAWADGMDNGYGLVDANGRPRQPLYDAFLDG